ncbi:alkane 1-monooxygenase [Rhodobacter capsulatus]|uniref:Alkane 1-monooxygenase n=1 Tax=Rhodobacter capsulatus TaxID=1061 RepID=A0A1G7CN68_RHOCA|nr:alkane 1-monooxygenase [Rhodobacter capsulatus]WER10718.1 alkane 1-monooxygenase [Rhodobacter capsulatus]SDE40116.1 alkane 1-monooxygenase [Rhodobacter capsulatus]
MTEKPAELSFAKLMVALRSLRKIGRETPEVDTFALFAFIPVPLIFLGALFGGVFSWLAIAWITVGIFVLDRRAPKPAPDAPEGAAFPKADKLSSALAITHFVLLPIVVASLAGFAGISTMGTLGLMIAAALWFGQVSNANAHELIHRADRKLFNLGKWVYISLLYGHHVSAHRLVHHVSVATPADPATATLGESYWNYASRSWSESFKAGYAREKAIIDARVKANPGKPTLRERLNRINPYATYVLGGLWFVIGAGLLFGSAGFASFLFLCALTQAQLMLSDYVQHYGLVRQETAPGEYEPVSAAHSWDAIETGSALMMLNAPRHSDHHAHPARPYPALQLGDLKAPGRPILPYSLPVMAMLALVPSQFAKLMDHRVLAVRKGESVYSEPKPKQAPAPAAAPTTAPTDDTGPLVLTDAEPAEAPAPEVSVAPAAPAPATAAEREKAEA